MSEKGKSANFMPDIIGNAEFCEKFSDDIRGDRLSHAYIIEGGRGMGKYTAALNIAAAACCEHRHDAAASVPCKRCEKCRKILSSISPDVILVEPEEDKATISVDQIRGVRDSVYFAPIEMPLKVFIIRDAKTMTPQAQNALLRTLEEPPEYVLFLLLTDNSRELLETVRSRAPTLRLKPLPDSEVRRYILENSDRARKVENEDPEEFERVIVSAGGSVGRALELLNPSGDGKLRRVYSLCDAFIEHISSAKSGGVKLEALMLFENTFFKERENAGEFLNAAILALCDLLLVRRSENSRLCYFTDRAAAYERSLNFTVSDIIRYIELCEAARVAITVRNSNIRLTLLDLVSNIFLPDARR